MNKKKIVYVIGLVVAILGSVLTYVNHTPSTEIVVVSDSTIVMDSVKLDSLVVDSVKIDTTKTK